MTQKRLQFSNECRIEVNALKIKTMRVTNPLFASSSPYQAWLKANRFGHLPIKRADASKSPAHYPSNRPEVRCSPHFLRYTPLRCLPRKLCPPHQWTQPLGSTPSLKSFAQMSQFSIARMELYRRHGQLDQTDPQMPPIVVLYSGGRQSKRCCRVTSIMAETCRSFAFSDWKAKSPVPIRPINVPITQKSRLFHTGRKSFPNKGLGHIVSGKEKEKDGFPCPPLSSKHPQKPRVFGGVFLWNTPVYHECAK